MSGSGNVLVTGGAGYVGSHACKALAHAGYTPVAFDNLVHGHRWAVKWGPLEVGDLKDAWTLMSVLRTYRPAAVLHFAAYAYVGESVQLPDRYYSNNVGGTLNLLHAALHAGIENIVFSSSCATYGLPTALPISEQHPQSPVNPYGRTKLVIEGALEDYATAYGIRYVSLRYFNAAGADPDGEIGEAHEPETHAIPLAIMTAAGKRPCFEIYGTDYPTADGTAIRDYVHVTDLADAHARALDYLLAGGRSLSLNLGTGSGHSVRQVIGAVEAAVGRPVPVKESPRRAGDPPVLVADAAKAREILDWRPRFPNLAAIVSSAADWHLKR